MKKKVIRTMVVLGLLLGACAGEGDSGATDDPVRPEEFVNFFDMGYQPPSEETFAIHVDGAETPYYDDSVVVRVGIAATDIEAEVRPDVNLTLVVDTSGSMEEGDRLELVKGSLEYLVDELRPEDRIAIVEYSEDARVVLESTPVDDDDSILDAVDALLPRASTNAEAGLELGYELANETLVVDDSNMVLLLSDGVANVGAETPGGILETLAEPNERGIDLLTVGVGLGNYNDELMEQLADRANGQYRYVDTFDEVERVFGEDLTGSIVTLARDAKVQVSFDADNVDSYRLIGYTGDWDDSEPHFRLAATVGAFGEWIGDRDAARDIDLDDIEDNSDDLEDELESPDVRDAEDLF